MLSRIATLRVWLILAAGVGAEWTVARAGADQPAPGLRQWHSRNGKHSVNAALIEVRDQTVLLQRADGKQIEVDRGSLSDPDRTFVRQWPGPVGEAPAGTSRGAPADPPAPGPTYGNDSRVRVKLGVEISAPTASFRQLVVTFPLPLDWPEQSVEVVDQELSPRVTKIRNNVLADGVMQMVIHIPRLAAGETARVVYVMDVDRRWIYAPAAPHTLVAPRHVPRHFRRYLEPSPGIETDHPQIQEAARKFAIDSERPVWPQVEAIYRWVRQHIRHEGTVPLHGALTALRQQQGDCEEYTSLFVALCRVNGIPARSVWIPGHTYPEFYLEDQQGQGYWFPCESLGEYAFGHLHRHQVVLQKGDRFKMSQKKELQRYVSETLTGLPADNSGDQPVLRPVREFSDRDQP